MNPAGTVKRISCIFQWQKLRMPSILFLLYSDFNLRFVSRSSLYGKFFTALGAPSADYAASSRGAHSFTKTVCPLAFFVMRTIRRICHDLLLLIAVRVRKKVFPNFDLLFYLSAGKKSNPPEKPGDPYLFHYFKGIWVFCLMLNEQLSILKEFFIFF